MKLSLRKVHTSLYWVVMRITQINRSMHWNYYDGKFDLNKIIVGYNFCGIESTQAKVYLSKIKTSCNFNKMKIFPRIK